MRFVIPTALKDAPSFLLSFFYSSELLLIAVGSIGEAVLGRRLRHLEVLFKW